MIRGRQIINKGDPKQEFNFTLLNPEIEYKIGKNGKVVEQLDKHGFKQIKTKNLKLGLRGAASKAVLVLFRKILKSIAARNSISNSTKRHEQNVEFIYKSSLKKDNIIFVYKCSGLLNPISKTKLIKTKNKKRIY